MVTVLDKILIAKLVHEYRCPAFRVKAQIDVDPALQQVSSKRMEVSIEIGVPAECTGDRGGWDVTDPQVSLIAEIQGVDISKTL